MNVSADDLQARLVAYEVRYGVPSERLADAFRNEHGELVETDDFHRWCSLYSAWELATRQLP